MARFDTAFDATGIEPTTAYELLPAGKYRAQIVESEMRVTRNGMGQFLWLMLDILEGAAQGPEDLRPAEPGEPEPDHGRDRAAHAVGDLPRDGQDAGQRQRGAAPDPDDDPGDGEAAEERLRREQRDPLPAAGTGQAAASQATPHAQPRRRSRSPAPKMASAPWNKKG